MSLLHIWWWDPETWRTWIICLCFWISLQVGRLNLFLAFLMSLCFDSKLPEYPAQLMSTPILCSFLYANIWKMPHFCSTNLDIYHTLSRIQTDSSHLLSKVLLLASRQFIPWLHAKSTLGICPEELAQHLWEQEPPAHQIWFQKRHLHGQDGASICWRSNDKVASNAPAPSSAALLLVASHHTWK